MSRDYYAQGQYNMICDRTGQKMKSSEARREWNGFIVHHSVFLERHPQDYVKPVPQEPAPKNLRPRAERTYLATNEVTVESL